tara:strand:- start:3095 stop:3481 length:387 start_codon:yes stop_codon:yes gene_type:complete
VEDNDNINNDKLHLLQKHKVLTEFDIVSVTSLEDFMETYDKIANTSDDIGELYEVSKLLSKNTTDIPGFIIKGENKESSNPELNNIVYALIEFIMKKTDKPGDWAYILTNVINKMGLELNDQDDDDIE